MLRLPKFVTARIGRRFLHIRTLTTPNDNARKFQSIDGELLQPRGSKSVVIKNTDTTLIRKSKLAERIFTQCPGVEALLVGDDFLTVNKDGGVPWPQIEPRVTELLLAQLGSDEELLSKAFRTALEDADGGYRITDDRYNVELSEEQQEVRELIEELIDTRIRPAIVEDGGDIVLRGWDPKSGTVYLKLQGACSTCSSSEVTLKYGIESMLKHYVEEVQEVVQILDPEQEISIREFDKLEKKLGHEKQQPKQ